MFRLIFLVPLACWLLVSPSSRYRLRVGLALAAITVVQLVVSFEAWSLRWCFDSLEVLLSFAGAAVLVIGLVIESRTSRVPSGRRPVAAAVAALYCGALVLGTGWLTLVSSGTLDGPGGNGGKHPPIPPADALGTLPSGLKILADSAGCSQTNWGPWCVRTFSIGSTDGVPENQVVERIVQYLQDSHRLPPTLSASGEDGRAWETCRTTGWWLDVENERTGVYTKSGGVVGTEAIPWPDYAPNGATTVVSIELDHQGC